MVEQRSEDADGGIEGEPKFYAPVHRGPGDKGKRVFETDDEEAGEHVEDLEDGDGFDDGVEGDGEEVPEDFGPEEGVE